MRAISDRRQQLKQKLLDALRAKDPRRDPSLRVTGFGECDEQSIRYFLYADVIAELFKAARYRRELATAVLMGRFCVDDNGPFIEVSAFRRLQYLYGGDPVELTLENVEELHAQVESDGNDDSRRHIVGGFVADPESKGRLDEDAARLHLSLFNLPYQPVIVADGAGDRLGVYARGPRSGFVNAAFYVVEQEASMPADHCDSYESPTEDKRQGQKEVNSENAVGRGDEETGPAVAACGRTDC